MLNFGRIVLKINFPKPKVWHPGNSKYHIIKSVYDIGLKRESENIVFGAKKRQWLQELNLEGTKEQSSSPLLSSDVLKFLGTVFLCEPGCSEKLKHWKSEQEKTVFIWNFCMTRLCCIVRPSKPLFPRLLPFDQKLILFFRAHWWKKSALCPCLIWLLT